MMAEQVTMWRSKVGTLHESQADAEYADRKNFLSEYLNQFWNDGEFNQDMAVNAMLKDLEIMVKP